MTLGFVKRTVAGYLAVWLGLAGWTFHAAGDACEVAADRLLGFAPRGS